MRVRVCVCVSVSGFNYGKLPLMMGRKLGEKGRGMKLNNEAQ